MRARNLKPGLFKNELLGTADPLFTLIFEGLWCAADREGRLEDRPMRLHAEINPYRDPKGTIDALHWLTESGFIVRYEVGGAKFIQVVNFHRHQNPHQRESASDLPPPAGTDDRYVDEPITSDQRARIMARDGGACQECGSTDRPHLDHIVPRSRGGSSEDSNLQILCANCNTKKGARTQPRQEQGTAKDMPSPGKARPSPSDSPFLTPDSPIQGTDGADVWREWIEHRKRKRWPCDETTLRKQLKMLAPFDNATRVQIIETSINAGWQGLFPPKGPAKPSAPPKREREPTADEIAAARALAAAENATGIAKALKLPSLGGAR